MLEQRPYPTDTRPKSKRARRLLARMLGATDPNTRRGTAQKATTSDDTPS
jgi:hypothetical protein